MAAQMNLNPRPDHTPKTRRATRNLIAIVSH